MPIGVRNILVQGTFGIELRQKCRKTESFEVEGTEALPQLVYIFTAHPRNLLIINGAGEGNRTLVFIPKKYLRKSLIT